MRQKLLLFCLLTIATAWQSAKAYDFTVNGIYYGYDSSTQTAYVTSGDNDYAGDVFIPDNVTFNGRTMKVTKIVEKCFQGMDGVESVRIGDNVTTIGEKAFMLCSRLVTVNVGHSVASIPYQCFYSCRKLETVTMSIGLTGIGKQAFGNCESLKKLDIPNSVSRIGYQAFYNCKWLATVKMSTSLEYLDESAFEDCSALTSITFPNTLTKVPAKTFYKCSSLEEVGLGVNVEIIDHAAFYKCSKLNNIYIPKKVTKIADGAFSGCSSLRQIVIPSSVNLIEDAAFEDCTNLTDVVLESGTEVLVLDDANLVKGATSLFLGRTCKSTWADYIFGGVFSLKTLTIGATVTDLDFSSSNQLEKVYCKSTQPSNITCSFHNTAYISAKLYVPRGTKTKYQSAQGWKEFWSIEEMDVANMPGGNEGQEHIIITADDKEMEYGDDVPTLTYTVSGGTMTGTPKLTTVATKTADVGHYTIECSLGTVTNANASCVNGTMTVNKAPLTVQPLNVTIYEGEEIPTIQIKCTGYKNGQGSEVFTTIPSCRVNGTSSRTPAAGTYTITVSGGEARNYELIYKTATLTVLKQGDSEESLNQIGDDVVVKITGTNGKYYEGLQADVDVAAILATLSVQSLNDVIIYAVQSDGSRDEDYKLGKTDGWRNEKGDWKAWSENAAEAGNFYVKADFERTSGQIYEAGCYPGKCTDVQYTATYAFVKKGSMTNEAVILKVVLFYGETTPNQIGDDVVVKITGTNGKYYEGLQADVDVAAILATLSVQSLNDVIIYAVQSDGSRDEDYKLGKTDGWRDEKGDWKAWSDNAAEAGNFYVKADFERTSGQIYEAGCYPGKCTDVQYTATYAFMKKSSLTNEAVILKVVLSYGVPTSISHIEYNLPDGNIYDLTGRRVSKVNLSKGIYIIGGRKVLVK